MNKSAKIFSLFLAVILSILICLVAVFASSNLDFVVSGNIEYTATNLLKYDEGKGYYYVEMGTYNEAPVRWRYVGYVAEDGIYVSSTTPIEGQQAIFYQETFLGEEDSYWGIMYGETEEWPASYTDAFNSSDSNYEDGTYANDYALSDIREFMAGDFLSKINIDENDMVYKSIIGRNLESLYSNINWNNNTGAVSAGSISTLATEQTGGDKLWLMSVEELLVLIGGQTMTDGVITYPDSDTTKKITYGTHEDEYPYWSDLAWNPNGEMMGEIFWLRSPYPAYAYIAYLVHYGGVWSGYIVGVTYAVRAAFILGI